MQVEARKSLRRGTVVLAGVVGLLAGAAGGAAAQSIGVEAGVASVESFGGVRPNLGVSLFIPFTRDLRVVLSGSQWTGCPEGGCVEPRTGYGNRSLNALALYRLMEGARNSLSLGAGMGWYEMKRPEEGGTGVESHYDEAFTFAAEARREVAYNSAVYLRGETSVPTDDSVTRWGALRLGVDVRVF